MQLHTYGESIFLLLALTKPDHNRNLSTRTKNNGKNENRNHNREYHLSPVFRLVWSWRMLWPISALLRRIPALLRWALPISLLGLLTVALLRRVAARLLSISLRRLAR